ncbi:MAG: NUDIX hydrolase [Proteobacteria bacterium]|nr:NUDIX hydrolase [Pseudomonadota bacterium]
MHRRPLLDLLERYEAVCPEQQCSVERVRALVRSHVDCLERTCLPGHVTASAWILSHDDRCFLLTHHRKLGRWLQLGGHADGEPDVAQVALREAREESGMLEFDWVTTRGELLPVDVDVHRIPPFGAEPAHEHHDIRFVLRAKPGQALRMSAESRDLRWFEMEPMHAIVVEESLARLGRRARELLRSEGRGGD